MSTPVSWDEVEACAAGEVRLQFDAPAVLERVAHVGDLFEAVLEVEQILPAHYDESTRSSLS